ncbi:MAG: hypothetical protein WC766_02130 [Patescibacteria group bacterium]|jgi:hypothetical protein
MFFKKFLVPLLFIVWALAHWIMISYGTQFVPLHSFYASADEQSPILGVMHVLEERSVFAMRGHESVYYGPVFSVIAAPAVILDAAHAYFAGYVKSAADYRVWFSFNWGSVLFLERWVSVIVGFVGLLYTWRLFNLAVINPDRKKWVAWLGVALIATNFYYFLYSGWLRHWIFVTVFLIMQIYYLIQIMERDRKSDWIWMGVLSFLGFGIAYVTLILQIMWLPVLIVWLRKKDYSKIKSFVFYLAFLILSSILCVFWNPTPYLRYAGLSKTAGLQFHLWSQPSLYYYLKILVFNQPFLSFAFLLAAVFVVILQRQYKIYWVWSIGLAGLVHLLFFSANVHSEPRYIMPATMAAVLLTVGLLAQWKVGDVWKKLFAATVILLGLEIAWQTASVSLWSYAAVKGPEDKPLIAWLNSLPPDKKVLVDAWHFLGAAHDKKIIKEYSDTRFEGKGLSNMLTYFSQTDPPAWTPAINNIVYMYGDKVTGNHKKSELDYFAHYYGEPLTTNFFEERLTRLWFMSDLRQWYSVTDLKTGLELEQGSLLRK